MLRNYLVIAFRNLFRQKLNSIVNVSGLCIGLTCSLFIIYHVKEELSYDKGFSKADRIYRITLENKGKDTRHWAATPPPMASEMVQTIPEIETIARFHRPYPDRVFSHRPASGAPMRFEEKNGFYADHSVIDVFDFKFLEGNAQTALQTENTIVLTQATAHKYFGQENPVGKIMHDDMDNNPLTVTGVIQDLPFSSHLKFDYLISMATRYQGGDKESLNNRGWASFYNYVVLRTPQSKTSVEAKMPEFMVKFYEPDGETKEEILSSRKLHLQTITSIHLHSKLEKEMAPNSDMAYVYIFSVAALLILLLAAVNFINISTAQAFGRMKEVGVRKVVGASKAQLIRQFMGESVLLTTIAASLGVGLFAITIPFYNKLTGKNIHFEALLTLPNILLVVALILLIGWLAGSYPAWFVTSFNSIDSLKAKKNAIGSVNFVRKGLVVFQFSVSVFMIFSTIIIYQQLRFFHTKDVGFDKDQLVAVKMYGDMFGKLEVIMQSLKKNPAVTDFSMTAALPGDRLGMEMFTPVTNPDQAIQLRHLYVNANFIPTMHMALTEGSNFNNLPLTKTAYILNEAAVKAMQLKSPVGKQFISGRDTSEIVGVVKDFHYASLHTTVEPMVIVHKPFWTNYMLINIRGNQLPVALQALESTFTNLSPGSLFSYTFLNEKLNRLYEPENKMSQIFKVFALFAISISCLGLFSLSVYAAELRTKEVGIRKVLGASVSGIVVLLSKDFLKMVLLATIVAWPLAWWAMSKWLEGFAYRITIDVWVFILSGMAALVIALLTVSYQSIKAALANPVKSLKSE